MSTKKRTARRDKTGSKRQPVNQAIANSNTLAPQPAHPAAVIQRARQAPTSLSSAEMRQLQRAIGNQAVGKLLSSPQPRSVIQPKLQVGPAHDVYEQEADQVVAQVRRRPVSASSPVKEAGNSQPATLGERLTPVQRQSESASGAGFQVEPEIEQRITHHSQAGQPLPETVRQSLEPHFGADFSGVRVHTDAAADQLNQSLQAEAFTTGQNIFFRRGGYAPGTPSGQQLLAHELTHVIQQTGADREMKNGSPSVIPPSAPEATQRAGEGQSVVQRKILLNGEPVDDLLELLDDWSKDKTARVIIANWALCYLGKASALICK